MCSSFARAPRELRRNRLPPSFYLASAVHVLAVPNLDDGDDQLIVQNLIDDAGLADALATLAAMDGRYEWREMDGVIVFRPAEAWRDGLDPLFLPVRDVQLQRVTLSTVMGLIASALKAPEHSTNYGFPDTRRISIDMPAASVLDFLNAAAKSHGQLTWQFDELSRDDQRTSGGRRHVVGVKIFWGTAHGLMVP